MIELIRKLALAESTQNKVNFFLKISYIYDYVILFSGGKGEAIALSS